MRRFAIFVDAGYFWVQATHIVHHQRLGRESIVLDYPQLRHELLALAKAEFPEAHLLRVYWYDGPGISGKTDSHEAIEALDDFKLRMGVRSGVGDQKAVDGLLIADLINLAQNRSISDALLLSGDADLTPGVVAAQSLGIRVHLLTMGPSNATSPHLLAEADCKSHWDDSAVRRFASATTMQSGSAQTPQADHLPDWDIIARKTYAALTQEQRLQISPHGRIAEEIDRALLRNARTVLKRNLEETEKRQLRDVLKSIANSASSSVSAAERHG